MSETKLQMIFRGGKILDNFETLGAVAFKEFVVPAGKRWLVFGGHAERDQSATLVISATNAADKRIFALAEVAAATSNIDWGTVANSTANRTQYPFPLAAGMKVRYQYGAAQTTPEVALLVLEIDE